MTETATVLRYAAFTRDGTGGNPAGVVLDAAALDDAARLALAAEVGYSETAFLEFQGEDGDGRRYRMRYFSPRAEVAFCGHATIASAVAVAERHGPGTMVFETLAGPVTVRTQVEPGGITGTLTSVPTHTRTAEPGEVSAALAALRWNLGDLDDRYPPHVAFAGNDHLVLAVRQRALLAALDYDYPELDLLMAERNWTTLQLVHEDAPRLYSARDPFPPGGVVEDPATGAAAAAFGGYLRSVGLVDPPDTVTIIQGEDLGRPSELIVTIPPGDRIDVTGHAAPIKDA